jgi:hypothetical protein
MDSVMAQTLSLKLDVIQTIDRMIATAEARRNGILREIDRHRENAETGRASGGAAKSTIVSSA